jgi:hypothetical protein
MRVCLAFVMLLAVGSGAGCGHDKSDPPSQASEPAQSARPALAGQKPDRDLLARLHFIGSTQLLADKPKAANLNEIANLPETDALQRDLLQKLATTPYRFLRERKKLPEGVTNHAELIRPLVEDLVHNESYMELRGPTNPVPELLLAVRLSKERAELWRTNLSAVLTDWTKLPINEIQAEGYQAWELKKHKPPNVVRFVQAGDWALFCWGQDGVTGLPAMLQRIKADGQPAPPMHDHWLEAWADWPRLLPQYANSNLFKLPIMQLALGLKDDDVRTRAVLQFPEPLNLALPEWKFPSNSMHNPLVNFTAVRGIAPWLGRMPLFQQLALNPMPNQFCAWAMQGIPFETYLATPVASATNFVQQTSSRLISLMNSNLIERRLGQLTWDETNTTLNWTGVLPLVTPYLTTISTNEGEFALLGLFHGPTRSTNAPRELFAQMIGHTNQVLYDWEITSERVGQWWNLITLHHMLTGTLFGSQNELAQKWITAISRKAGNAGTEIRLTAPNELTLVRRSPLGLASFELASLLFWEGAPGFPLHGEPERPPHMRVPSNRAQNRPPGNGPALPSTVPRPVSAPPK